MKKLKIAIFIALIIIPVSSQAETKYEAAYGKCITEAGTMNNGVMVSCSETVSTLAKNDINVFYKKIEDKAKDYTDPERIIKILETSQKAWIQYRDNHCTLSELIHVHKPYCLMLVNSQRAEELKKMAE